MAKRWTPEEITNLTRAVKRGDGPDDLVKQFGRKIGTINAKATSLGLKTKGGARKKRGGGAGAAWGPEVEKLQSMIDNRATARELADAFNRPFDEILAEAEKLSMDCGYLKGEGSSSSFALPFEKEIKSRLGLVLDLDVKVNIRTFQVVVGKQGG